MGWVKSLTKKIKIRYWSFVSFHFVIIFLRINFLLEREEGKEKERERNINVWLSLAHPPLGNWPTTQKCALTGN